ncbi:MAG: amidohydrolase family protein [Promethearchaeota archaeon]
MIKIDFHCHLFSDLDNEQLKSRIFKDFKGYGFYERLMQNLEHITSINTSNIIEKTLYHAKKAGIDKIVLLPLSKKENELVNEWVKAEPSIFIPFYNPPEKVNSHETIEDTLMADFHEIHFKGYKIMLSFREKRLDDKILYPALELAQEKDLVALFHTGYPPPGTFKKVLSHANPIYLENIIHSFPKLKIVIAHMGFPWTDLTLALAVQYPNVHVDISNMTYMMPNHLEHLLLQAKELIGTDKILFGTDGFIPEMLELTVNSFNNTSVLSNEEKEKILGGNAAKLLKISGI